MEHVSCRVVRDKYLRHMCSLPRDCATMAKLHASGCSVWLLAKQHPYLWESDLIFTAKLLNRRFCCHSEGGASLRQSSFMNKCH